MSAPIQFSPKISDAVAKWQSACDQLERAELMLEGAKKAQTQAGREVAQLLVPSDAEDDEIFSMWVGDTLIQVWQTTGQFGHEYHAKNRES